MKIMFSLVLSLTFSLFVPQSAQAHGGGLDWQGGHNCRVGSCAGTYHCNQPGAGVCANNKKPSPKKTSIKTERG